MRILSKINQLGLSGSINTRLWFNIIHFTNVLKINEPGLGSLNLSVKGAFHGSFTGGILGYTFGAVFCFGGH